ncbi:MAG: protein jag [Epulopiscium sp.]|nr:protein jag [Candidatus Epulonipiscium sp.]
MEFIEKTGRTVDEAITEALIELGATRDDVEIEVVDEGSKGFLGLFGTKIAKVRVSKKITAEAIAKQFLSEVFDAMQIEVIIDTQLQSDGLDINLQGDQMGILIGKRGQTLDALQYLVSLVVNKSEEGYVRVRLDAENYRERRKETLENLANNLAKKVRNTRKRVVLEPMNPYERRIIHSTLQGNPYVKTQSEGEEPYRKVVILPQSKEKKHIKTQ